MSHTGLLSLFSNSSSARQVVDAIAQKEVPVVLAGAQGYARAFYSAVVYRHFRKHMLIVCPTPEKAVVLHKSLSGLIGCDDVVLFPASEVMPFERQGSSELLWQRILCLSRLVSESHKNRPVIVVASAVALFRKLMPKNQFLRGCIKLRKGMTILPDKIVRKLVGYGYVRVSTVTNKGEVAVRGGILDVFPPVADYPYRIDFFDDEVDSMRMFDPDSQISTQDVDEILIVPAVDWLADLELHQNENSYERLGVLTYFHRPPFIAVDNYNKCIASLTEFEQIGVEIASARLVAGMMNSQDTSIYHYASEIELILNDMSLAFALFAGVPQGFSPRSIVDTVTSLQIGFAGRRREMIGELKQLVSDGTKVVLLAGSDERREMLKNWLKAEGIKVFVQNNIVLEPEPGAVTLCLGSGESGFNCHQISLSVFTETEIYGKSKVRHIKRRKTGTLNWRELSPGDYVVHANHGVARFLGISNMTVNGATRDYLHLRYAANDALYVPVDQVDLVEKYVGSEGSRPSLQRLGSGEWQRIKDRVRRSVEDMARKLLVLEAKRKSVQGHSFSVDSPWQRQFEDEFEYEDTEDQAISTHEIKMDMEKPYPMDRLLCGDVGFGKTEVAMRAAFKAVMDSKQVAVLVPTTVLAEQHFNTFSDRFANYPISVQALSRFRSGLQQRKILSDVAKGLVDILIGTHRLLSSDVKFQDLGLVIVDEEHRFGVAQKERLKLIAETCDVLMLTATPIPRTLNMALTGIRDVSLMETPPEGRFPVETYVIEYNPSLIAQAIKREIRRNGQIFYVHNKVHSISRAVERVRSYVPEARIAVGHGRMNEKVLASTMRRFLQGEFDILISTTIIESGLDLPNVNTLIVEDADKLGLAQLYQLRGRVGRTNKIAYAYFTFKSGGRLTTEAEQRLTALRDFAVMGSGYRLALRDLEIRGAGNLLGPEQHGFMALVGYDMYVKLLEKAVANLRGEQREQPKQIQTLIEIPCDAYLPKHYVESPKERFLLYKRVADAGDLGLLSDIEMEIEDRYGNLPKQVKNLLDVARLKTLCSSLGITRVSVMETDLIMAKQRLSFKIEIPHVFPFDKIYLIKKRYPSLNFDARGSVLSLALFDKSPDAVLKLSIKLIEELSSR